METQLEIGAACALLFVLAFLSTLDVAFGQLSDVGLRRLTGEREERPGRSVQFLGEVLENRPRFRFTLNAAIQVVLVAVVVLVTSVCFQLLGAERRFLLIAFFIALALTTLFRQVIPRLLAAGSPERTLLMLLPLYRPFYGVLSLFAAPRQAAAERARRGGDDIHLTRAAAEAAESGDDDDGGDLQALIDVGEEEGILEEEEGELIQSIIEFGETRAVEVMTPCTAIVPLPVMAILRERR